MIVTRAHAFHDDILGTHDAVALAAMVRDRQVSVDELATAAIARAEQVDDALHAVVVLDQPRIGRDADAPFYGVPTFVKDNSDVAGLPTNHGSEAFIASPATRDGAYVEQFLGTGLTMLGKSRLPEFGFNATTEFMTESPAHNPWNLDRSVGASSGGSAAMAAAGVVPIAHANDGGGSIGIPAACTGLVGLKPTKGRHIDAEQARHLPINMVSEGVLTRSVRDTAAFIAAAEDVWRNPALPPIGSVRGPADRRLRVGLILDTITGATVDDETRKAVERAATLLEAAGHVIEPVPLPVTMQFADDFLQYWALLADLATTTGRLTYDRSFDRSRTDGLTKGLRAFHRANLWRTPGALRRLKRIPAVYAEAFARHEVVLSPVLAHVTPELGYLSPTVEFDALRERLFSYVCFTPLNNIAGSPAISLPLGMSAVGVPIGVHLSAAHGDERTLIELAYQLEAASPFPVITG